MSIVLIVYFSHSGNTRKMAEAITIGLESAGCLVQLQKVTETNINSLAKVDGIILGSSCYFGNIATPMKQFIDQSIKLFSKKQLEGKPGGAFVSTGIIGGGGELALLSLITSQLIHGMIIQGVHKGGHFGPLAIGCPDERCLNECYRYGRQFVKLVQRLKKNR